MPDRRTALFWFLYLLLAGTVTAAPLQFSVTTDVSQPGTWFYTAFNDEPPGSPLFISSFAVVLNGPILVFGAPDGWTTETDYISHVLWFNLDTALPYPHDIAPGESLGGFFIESPDFFIPCCPDKYHPSSCNSRRTKILTSRVNSFGF